MDSVTISPVSLSMAHVGNPNERLVCAVRVWVIEFVLFKGH